MPNTNSLLKPNKGIFPIPIQHSALMENGYTSTGTVATNCTIAFGFKPTGATQAPLNDMTGHYLLTIQKQGATVKVWKQGIQLANYTGTVGASYAEFVANVLTFYSGSNNGYYSRITIVEAIKTYTDFWEVSDTVAGLWTPKELHGLTLHTLLDFENSVSLGNDTSGNENHWTLVSPTQTTDTPTKNYATLNPLHSYSDGTFLNGNLKVDITQAKKSNSFTSFSFNNDMNVYAEFELIGGSGPANGVCGISKQENRPANQDFGILPNDYSLYNVTGQLYSNATMTNKGFPSYTVGDTISFKWTGESGTLEARKNDNAWIAIATGLNGEFFFGCGSASSLGSATWVTRFGATPFKYELPAEYNHLCRDNRPTPLILNSAAVVDLIKRTGTGDGFIDMTDVGLGVATVSRPSQYSSSGVFHYTGTGLNDGWHKALLSSDFLRYTFTEPQVVSHMKMYNRSDQDAWSITGFTLQGSHDGNNWTNLLVVSNRAKTKGLITSHAINNSVAYKHYQVTNMQGSSYVDLAHLVFGRIDETEVQLPDMENGPDMVLSKGLGVSTSWGLVDSLRGDEMTIYPNQTSGQNTESGGLTLKADGYLLGENSSWNQNGYDYLDLCFKADTKAGFAIHKLDNYVAGTTLSNTLGKPVTFAIMKVYDTASDWWVFHKDLGNSYQLKLNKADAKNTVSGSGWFAQNTFSTLELGSWIDGFAGNNLVLYTWTDSEVFKAFSYNSNNLADGPDFHLGGKPLSIPFMKNTTTNGTAWRCWDAARTPSNHIDRELYPSAALPDSFSGSVLDFTSQGFKVIKQTLSENNNNDLVVGLAILESTKYNNAF